ncbi:hypothetical protein JIG36_02205 [Actinoplanes sp. LDG1-06]|uniref:Fibronectin type-III domain-containing protein n=1 Tax=Paractinoplanes ovalisporus TaxID=2810368 RepID=A0ABS2A3E7_9ACTN|nr:hypothetical protein [Actinoplanes ovalisporus]MBM2614369.1 hypothetical protein [Actinoplanes ovalisporus]
MATRQARVRGAIIATTAAAALGTGMIVFAAQSSAETTGSSTSPAKVKVMTTAPPPVGQAVKFAVFGQDYGKAMVTWSAPEAPAGVEFTGFRLWVISDDPAGRPPTETTTPPPPGAPGIKAAVASPTPPPTTEPPKPNVVRNLPADARVTVVTGLSERFNYTFHLVATSAKGETPDATATLRRTTVKLTAVPSTAVYGAPVTLTLQVVRAGDGPKAGEAVTLERRAAGSPDWGHVGNPRTGANLKWSVVTRPPTTTVYRTHFTGSKGMWPADDASATVTLRYLVSVKASTAKPKAGQKVTISGAVRPVKAGLKISLQRYAAGKWVTISGGVTRADGSYAIARTFTKGTWPLRVIAAGGTTIAYGTSGQVTLVVK